MSAESDAHGEMLDLAVRLAQREASGPPLSAAERVVSDIMWMGTQVFPNGFDGWLAYTSCARMSGTLSGLDEVGCSELAEIVREALNVAGVDPERLPDHERERQLDALTDDDRGLLEEVDAKFYDSFEPSMVVCRRYAMSHGIL